MDLTTFLLLKSNKIGAYGSVGTCRKYAISFTNEFVSCTEVIHMNHNIIMARFSSNSYEKYECRRHHHAT